MSWGRTLRRSRKPRITREQRSKILDVLMPRVVRRLAHRWDPSSDDVGVVILVLDEHLRSVGMDRAIYELHYSEPPDDVLVDFLSRSEILHLLHQRIQEADRSRKPILEHMASGLRVSPDTGVHCAFMIGGHEALAIIDREELEAASHEPLEIDALIVSCLTKKMALVFVDSEIEALATEHRMVSEPVVKARELLEHKWNDVDGLLDGLIKLCPPFDEWPDTHSERIVAMVFSVLTRSTMERRTAFRAGLRPPDEP